VLLPKKTDGLSDLEKSLSLDRLQSILSKLETQKVFACIPRFKMEAAFVGGAASETVIAVNVLFDFMAGNRFLARHKNKMNLATA